MLIKNIFADFKRLYSTTQGNKLFKFLKIFFIPSFHITFVYRLGHSFSKTWPPFRWLLLLIYLPLVLVIKIVYNTSLAAKAKIGPGFIILHPGAIFIHPASVIDKNVTIGSQVVVGAARLKDKKYPVISNNVFIGSGAKILGAVIVNHHCTVGANTVLLKDAPANSVVVGNPGKVIKINKPLKYRGRNTNSSNSNRSNHNNQRRSRPRNQNVRIRNDNRSGIIHVSKDK